MQEITSNSELQAFKSSNKLAVVFFGQAWCGHCKHITPVIQQLAAAHPQVKFGHVEGTKVKIEGCSGFPTFTGYKNGVYVDMVKGADEDSINAMISRLESGEVFPALPGSQCSIPF